MQSASKLVGPAGPGQAEAGVKLGSGGLQDCCDVIMQPRQGELVMQDNITSCNKVENCLMLSEYEQNLIKEKEGPVSLACRRARKWSLVRQSSSIMQGQ